MAYGFECIKCKSLWIKTFQRLLASQEPRISRRYEQNISDSDEVIQSLSGMFKLTLIFASNPLLRTLLRNSIAARQFLPSTCIQSGIFTGSSPPGANKFLISSAVRSRILLLWDTIVREPVSTEQIMSAVAMPLTFRRTKCRENADLCTDLCTDKLRSIQLVAYARETDSEQKSL